MAKKQTRRSISVSRTTYERLKAFCETNNISMSQFVETRVGDFLGGEAPTTIMPTQPRPTAPVPAKPAAPSPAKPETRPAAQPGPDDLGGRALRGRAAPAGDQAPRCGGRAGARSRSRSAPSRSSLSDRSSIASSRRRSAVAAPISSSERLRSSRDGSSVDSISSFAPSLARERGAASRRRSR